MSKWQSRQYQQDYLDGIKAEWQAGNRRVLMVANTGAGKCLGKGTPVMMADGTVKPVEDVKIGEFLMGPDSKPRLVRSLARGREMMYRIVPTKGDPFVCNESHILSVKLTPASIGEPARVVNLSVADYLRQGNTFKHRAKCYRVPVDFTHQDVPLDPYYVGLWLADGTALGTSITKPDDEVRQFVADFAASHGLMSYNSASGVGKCPMWSVTHGIKGKVNPVTAILRKLGVYGNKHVPNLYKVNSRAVRLALLAGILDGDGSMSRAGYDFCSTIESVSNDVAYIARSLGLAAYVKRRTTHSQHGTPCVSWRVSISGDCSVIPCKIARKKCPPRKQVKDVLVTGFTVETIGEGDYYGFDIDGDRLFLLGDFTVTHNTRMIGMMAEQMVRRGQERGRPFRMLLMAERRKLVEQLAGQMREVGIPWHVEMANLPDGETIGNEWVRKDRSAPVWVGSRDTILSRTDRHDWLDMPKFDLLIVDEAHLWERGQSRKLMETIAAPFVIGPTATPCYGDGTGLGTANWDAIVEKITMRQLVDMGVLTRVRYFEPPETKDKRKRGEKTGVVGNPLRHWLDKAEWRRTVAYFSRVTEALHWRDQFREKLGPKRAEVIDGKTPHKQRAEIFERIKAGEVLWCGSVGTLTTGVDVPEWEVCQLLIRCDSFVKYKQIGGRVMRACPSIGKEYCIFLDHSGAVEQHGLLDEPVEWRLEEDGSIEDRRKKEKEQGERPKTVNCHKCGCLFTGSPVCPECGEPIRRVEKKQEMDLGAELLVERGSVPDPVGQAQLLKRRMQKEWTTFLFMCRNRGWPVKKANGMFMGKFKQWPEDAGVTPLFDRQDRDRPMTEMDLRTGKRRNG